MATVFYLQLFNKCPCLEFCRNVYLSLHFKKSKPFIFYEKRETISSRSIDFHKGIPMRQH